MNTETTAVVEGKEYNVSPFFNDENPVHNGIYQRNFKNGIVFAYWFEGKWYAAHHTIEQALDNAKAKLNSFFNTKDRAWRGITNDN